jgi:predicted dehydrogenase
MCAAIQALPETQLRAVFDVDDVRAAQFSETYGAASAPSLDELLEVEADAVYVALPHDLLAPTAARALEAGRHVLVEKPMGLTVDAIRSLAHAAAARGLVAAPVFELRANSVFREARRRVPQIGDVKAVRIRTLIDKPAAYWDSGWRGRRAEAGGGVVLMNSIHQLDLVRHLTGLSFIRASADVETSYAEVEDSAAAVLRLSNGALVSLVAAAHSPGARGEERIELDGTLGRLDLPDPWGDDPLRVFNGEWHDVEIPRNDMYADFLRELVAGEAPATADDAAAALATVLAIYESARTRRQVEISR